jgi:tetratricopeptide (TPR) repeat protein
MIGYSALGHVATTRGEMDAAVEAWERAATHGQHAQVPYQGLVAACGASRFYGTTPLSELLAWQDRQEAAVRTHPRFRSQRAMCLAMLGRVGQARSVLAELRAELAERGRRSMHATVDVESGIAVELLAGSPDAAVAAGSAGCRVLEDRGEESVLSTASGELSEACFALGRIEEAEAWAKRAAELGTADDVATLMPWRRVMAKVLARRGEHVEAERLAREAVEISEKTDLLNDQAWAYADLADVLLLAGQTNDGAEALEEALARYERKENLVMAERVRARVAEVQLSDTALEQA